MSSRADSQIPADLFYTDNDEWVRVEGDTATIGITDYAQDQLSDIVFVEYLLETLPHLFCIFVFREVLDFHVVL